MRTATLDETLLNAKDHTRRVYILSSSLEYSPWRGEARRLLTNVVVVSSFDNETMIFPMDGYGRIVWNDLFMSRPSVPDDLALAAIGYRLDTTPTPTP